jgi:ATP-dependent DNA helicase RecG
MDFQTIDITKEQESKIASGEEGHFLDLKAVEILPAKLSRTLAAFANADGGEIYIGIDENTRSHTRSVRGCLRTEDFNSHLQLFEKLFPSGERFNYEFLRSSSGVLLHITVQKTQDIKLASDGTPYLRRGAQNIPLKTAEELERLRLNKGISSFESETLSIDKTLVTNSTTTLGFLIDVIPTAEPEPWLKKQLLIRDEKPTVGCVLLFAEEPQAILPKKCSIKLYRYQTKDREGSRETLVSDPITIEGYVYAQIRAVVDKTIEVIQSLNVLGPGGLEPVRYPKETLHEIITNAVLHRDYSIADDIHVRIFENRIEVQSPGRLPGHVTVKNILNERFARNGTLVRIINKFPDPPNKDVGEGLNTAFEAMRKLKLKDPIIIEREHDILVEIRHEPLASPEDLVLKFLQANGTINNSQAREVCHIGSENVMKRVFERLTRNDLIERVPGKGGRATAYRLKGGN